MEGYRGYQRVDKSYRRSQFYVEPETGILRQAQLASRKERRERWGRLYAQEDKDKAVALPEDLFARKIDGIWFVGYFARSEFTRKTEFFKIKQASKKEIREILKIASK
jgi:hypothetical protein